MFVLLIRWRISMRVIWLWRMLSTVIIFTTFLNDFDTEVCPNGGVVTFSDGHVDCSIHSEEVDEEEEEDSGGVPYL
jgi:hypothetical protein